LRGKTIAPEARDGVARGGNRRFAGLADECVITGGASSNAPARSPGRSAMRPGKAKALIQIKDGPGGASA
jgi:hypothetical protein